MSEDFIEVKESLIDMYNFNKNIKVELKPLGAKAILDYIDSKEKEIERLNNIIDGLEEWCLSWKENDKYCYLSSNDKDKCRYDIWEEVLDKLKELTGSDKDEKNINE